MPSVARVFIKVGLLWLVVGMVLGILIGAARAGFVPPWMLALAPTWVHLLTVGWLTQLIFGVAVWLFPRRSREHPFGPTGLAWVALCMLNVGLILRLAGEAAIERGGGPLLIASALAQWVGACLFTVYIWPRVRTR